MADIVISYDRRDSERAKEFVEAFEAAGCSTFWDRATESGAQWRKTIEGQIEVAARVVVLWSTRSVESVFVRDEADLARSCGSLVPVLIDRVKQPLGFGEIQHVDLIDRSPDEEEFISFVGSVIGPAKLNAEAAERASTWVRKAFNYRRWGNFEEAATMLMRALRRCEELLPEEERRAFDDSARYRNETCDELLAAAKEMFDGELRITLSGRSLLPIVDAKLSLQTERVRGHLGAGCRLHPDLERKEVTQVGIIIRPGGDVDNELLISKLIKEMSERGGALDLHCFLLVMNTDDVDRGRRFSKDAEKRGLRAKCITWRASDGHDKLRKRLSNTVKTLCEKASA